MFTKKELIAALEPHPDDWKVVVGAATGPECVIIDKTTSDDEPKIVLVIAGSDETDVAITQLESESREAMDRFRFQMTAYLKQDELRNATDLQFLKAVLDKFVVLNREIIQLENRLDRISGVMHGYGGKQ